MPPEFAQLDLLLRSKDVAERRDAAERLSRDPETTRQLAVAVVAGCGDSDEEVREWCVAALEESGAPVADDVDDLAKLLTHETSSVSYWAATLLGRVGSAASPAVAALADAVSSSPHTAVRERAVKALGQIGQATPAVIDALGVAATTDEPRLARLARRSLDALQS